MFPGAAWQRVDRDPAHGTRVQPPRAGLHHGAVQRRRGLRAGVQQAGRVRLLHAAVPDTLGIQSTIGRAEYHAMQLSLRKRFSEGYQFDVNYTLGFAKDHGSLLEGDGTFGNFDNGGYTGFLIDSWKPDKQYGRADFDVRHLVNFNWIAEVPVGRGRGSARTCQACSTPCWATGPRQASCAGAAASRSASTTAASAGPPTGTCRAMRCWSIPIVMPETSGRRANAVSGYPSPFADVEEALSMFRRARPGEVGCATSSRATATSRSTSA